MNAQARLLRLILRRGLASLPLAVLTTILVAWAAALRVQTLTSISSLYTRGAAATEDRVYRVTVVEGFGFRKEQWNTRDLNDGAFDTERVRKSAARLRLIGGAAAEAENTRSVAELIARSGGKSPALPDAARADDQAISGPPQDLTPHEIPPTGIDTSRYETGWPLLGMRFYLDSWSHLGPPDKNGLPSTLTPTSASRGRAQIPWPWAWAPTSATNATRTADLPMQLIASGFTANSAFYFALWMSVLVGPRLVRTAARRISGRCLWCGYDLRGLPPGAVCPECGVPSPHAAPPRR